MRLVSPLALISILCFSCVSVLAQEPTILRIGVALPSSGEKDVSDAQVRDRLVKTLNQRKFDKKLNLSLQAVALDATPGSKAIAEAREENCQFVLYSEVAPIESSYKFEAANGSPGDSIAVATATAQYQLRRAIDGVSFSIGIVKGEASVSARDAVLQAVDRLGGKVMADLKNSGNVALGAAPAAERVPLTQGPLFAGSDFCAWLPTNLPHAEALHGVCEYAIALPRDMPNFVCRQETSRYQGQNRDPVDLITATVRYEDGNESYSDLRLNGKSVSDAEGKAAGLWSSGQFEGNLRAIFHSGNHAVFEFSGENKIENKFGTHAVWVFTFQISRQNEPLWELRGEDQVTAPPYAGELWIDQKTGAVLLFRSAAKDLPPSFPMQSAEILIDYDNVAFGDGTAFVLPVESSVATKYQGMEPTRNVVQFSGCHRFHAKARLLMNLAEGASGGQSSDSSSEGSSSAAAGSADARKREAEEDEKIYAILREQAVREDAARLQAEQQSDLNAATVGAIWKMAVLEKQRESNAEQRANANHIAQSAASSAALSAAPPASPASGSAPETVFKVSVRLVPVSVVVRDTKGQAVGNLGKKDFLLFDERKPQPISSFTVEKEKGEREPEPAEQATPAPSAAPANSSADTSLKPAAQNRNTVAYVFDDLQTTFEDLANVIAAAERHLSALHPEDRVAIFTTSGQIGLDFTFDREKLQAVLRMLKPHSHVTSECPPVSYYMADLIANQGDAGASALAVDETMRCAGVTAAAARGIAKAKALEVVSLGRVESERTLQVLRDVIDRTTAMPGRRSIVLVSAGFLTVAPDAQDREMSLVDQAVRAGIVFNTLDVQGVPATGISGSNSEDFGRALFDRDEATARSEVLADLAYGTGGMFFHNNNDLQEGFRQTGDVPEYIYLLGFSPQKLDGKFHKLKVKVSGPEKVSVQARTGYYALKPASAQ
jgi:VWFA-related protein